MRENGGENLEKNIKMGHNKKTNYILRNVDKIHA